MQELYAALEAHCKWQEAVLALLKRWAQRLGTGLSQWSPGPSSGAPKFICEAVEDVA